MNWEFIYFFKRCLEMNCESFFNDRISQENLAITNDFEVCTLFQKRATKHSENETSADYI